VEEKKKNSTPRRNVEKFQGLNNEYMVLKVVLSFEKT
jgi:hypothetical protein